MGSGLRRYVVASRVVEVSGAGNRDTAWEMASASEHVALAWRAMESISGLPWWTLAAVRHAVEAFEFQARDWNTRAENVWPLDAGTQSGPHRHLPARPRPDRDR
jgi:hypothetical protein